MRHACKLALMRYSIPIPRPVGTGNFIDPRFFGRLNGAATNCMYATPVIIVVATSRSTLCPA
jgi:hypothetical protein